MNEDTQSSTTMQQEMKRARRNNRRDVIFCLVIIVAALLFQESRGSGKTVSVALSPDDTQFSVVAADGAVHDFAFAQADSLEYIEDLSALDRGELLHGTDEKKCTSGTFRNAAYGDYELHVMNKLHCAVAVHTPEGVLVFNYESDETTRAVYDYLCKHIPAD